MQTSRFMAVVTPRALAVALFSICFIACQEGPPATEVLVVVDSSPDTRDAVVRLEVQAFNGRDINSAKQVRHFDVSRNVHPLPVSFSIAAGSQHASGELRVVITGFDRTDVAIVEQQVITNFQPNRAGRLDVFLHQGCAGLCRAAGALGAETCGADGQCTPIPVAVRLPEAAPDQLGGYSPITFESGLDSGAFAGAEAGSQVSAPGASPINGAGSDASSPSSGGQVGGSVPDGSVPKDSGTGAPQDAGANVASDAGRDAMAATPDADVDTNVYARAPVIPTPGASCPSFVSGATTVMGVGVQIYAGPKAASSRAPLLFYWHGASSKSTEANSSLPAGVRDDIMAAGGIIVAPQSPGLGGGVDISGTGTWFQGDFAFSDLIAACAVRDHNVDPRRIYTTGCSSGGLAAGAMAFQRASYIAASAPNSGGLIDAGVAQVQAGATRAANVMAMHGGSSDQVVVSFTDTSTQLCRSAKATGALAVDCNHGGGHCAAPAALQLAAWQFMKDHPYGLASEPYAGGLPASFPSYCAISP